MLLVATVAAGCGVADPVGPATPKGSSAGSTPASDGVPSPTAQPLSAGRLDAADLLRAALPEDEIDPAGSSEKSMVERDPRSEPKPVSDPACLPTLDPYRGEPWTTTMVQTFHSKDRVDWTATTTLTAHSEPAAAAAQFGRLRKSLQDCREYRTPGPGTGTRATLSPAAPPTQGDEAVAYLLTSWTDVSDINPDVKEVRILQRLTVVRVGSVIAEFYPNPSHSAEAMEFPASLITRQVERLRAPR
ncbi:sensor domain-containing protein [Streptomyces sp. NPDC048383]|uniref:sensor domain-containing protein n=1 Tax=Streptomyces sp. NPDC048383 TaxID=3155386 RepID=UPI003421A78F